MTDLTQFIAGLPKAELHMHLEGSLEPELMFAIARRNKIEILYKTVDEVKEAYNFSNLQDFLDIYYQSANVLREEQDFHDLTAAYIKRVAADAARHVEVFFDPQTHTARGVAFSTVVDGMSSALKKAESAGVTSKLILCFLRHLSEDEAFETLRAAEPFLNRIAGVGLDSSEVGHPPAKFAKVFAAARERGLKIVAHAGEEGPPAYVWEALDLLHVDRLDHGNRSLEDPELVKRLVHEQMTLTVCPLSNLKLCVVNDMAAHPLKKMLALGLCATINSDDPAYFGGYLNDNYNAAAKGTGLTKAELVQLAKNSFLGSFLDGASITRHLAAVEDYASKN